ncbi:MAG: ABC transporter ATP-binding protein [Candidatus Adiutrix sp.]|jgi:iron complex transport system ATP-binding protein|nr:ABC transporter ATP-binding protein [Candidatus Adiutrix sp.]
MTEFVGLPRTGPWLAVRDLSFFYGPSPVLTDLNLDFYPGRHYIIAGPNGAGKSTLLDLLANLRKPAAGGIMVIGRPLAGLAPAKLARIMALAPQDVRLDFSFTVRQVTAMGRRPYQGRWGRLTPDDVVAVDRALAALNLLELAEKPVTALSGGEKRRVVAARALAQETPVILFDEPTAGLDVAQALALMELARRKADEGALVITVSHDLNLASTRGHEFVFLKKGRLAAAGPTGQVFTGDVLGDVYEAAARVMNDEFAGGLQAAFRPRESSNGRCG